jgi:ATP-dependent helicase HrpA
MRGEGTPPTSEIQGISCVAELVDLVRERKGAEPRFLMMEPDDLRDPEEIKYDVASFPESLPLENRAMPIAYAYRPGQVDDGVTVDVRVSEAGLLTTAALDWAVPGHLEAKVEHYLRATPKELRRAFMPLAETAKSVAIQLAQRDRLTGRRESLTEALVAQLAERFQIRIDPSLWNDKPLPDHLRARVRVLDDEGGEICASRDLAELQQALATRQREVSASVAKDDPQALRQARVRWEKAPQTSWTFGDVPERVPVGDQAGVPVYAFPGLKIEGEGVALRLFRQPEEASAATERGLERLIELHLRYELAWLEKDLRKLRELGTLTATLGPIETLMDQAYGSIRHWICDARRIKDNPPYLSEAKLTAALERARIDLRAIVPRLMDLLREILTLRQALLVHPNPYRGQGPELEALITPDFLRTTPYEQLAHFPRYLKAMRVRADRWRQNPAKDAERAKQLAPYVKAATELRGRPGGEALRWLVEEFRVSLFAQEIGTAGAVSVVKLDRALAEVKAGRGLALSKEAAKANEPEAKPATPPKPIMAAAVPDKKTGPLKSLGSLDSLFRKQ